MMVSINAGIGIEIVNFCTGNLSILDSRSFDLAQDRFRGNDDPPPQRWGLTDFETT